MEGLTQADDPRLAILWCKEALGHNGQRHEDGGRQVAFLKGGVAWISGEKWPAFLAEQDELLKHRSARAMGGQPLLVAIVEFSEGERTDRVDAPFTLEEYSKGPEGSGTRTASGSVLDRSNLVWYRPPLQNGYITRTLSFSNLVSGPVTITFVDGVPNVTNVVFKMQRKP